MSMCADTDHGVYDALPAREQDEPPGGAVLAVFHESGTLAGFAAPGFAWDARRGLLGYPVTLAGAVSEVADADVPCHGYDEHGAHSYADTMSETCTDLACELCHARAGKPCEVYCCADQAVPAS